MSSLTGRTALVTGASSGIGRAVVEKLTAAGATVHGVARRADRLERLAAETGCVAHVLDITDIPAMERLGAELSPDILVNNAGLGAGIAGLATASAEDITRTIGVNVAALLQALRIFLPGMRERGRGHVVNIGSVAGLYPIQSTVYGGSKGAVRLISQNLRLELRGANVRVTEICPARVATEFFDAAFEADPATRDKVKNTGVRELTPGDIADAIHYAVAAPAHVNVSCIELQPVEQSFGGMGFTPLAWEN